MPEQRQDRVAFRPAMDGDCRRIWEWRNEQAVREASFNTGYIPYEQHERWFLAKLADPSTRIFIVLDGQKQEVGYVRFEIKGERAEISVVIDKNKRRKGYGTAVIKSGSDYLLMKERVRRILAYIKVENVSSRVAFERAGFILVGQEVIAGAEAYHLVYHGNEIGTESEKVAKQW